MANLSNLCESAVETSNKSYANYHKHGAVLIRGGKIIASGVNDHRCHAEVNAIRELQRVLSKVG